jgi:hypothetical protein
MGHFSSVAEALLDVSTRPVGVHVSGIPIRHESHFEE